MTGGENMNVDMNGPFYDIKRYFHRLLTQVHSLFDHPNDISCINIRKDNHGRLVGWEIEKEKFIFKYRDDYLKVIERAQVKESQDCFSLKTFSYHFQPEEDSDLMQFRLDLDSVSLHGNPDEKFSQKEHLCYPEDLKLFLKDINALAAIFIAHTYLMSKEYPFDNDYAEKYNEIISNAVGGHKVG